MAKVETEAVPFYYFLLPLPRKFAASTASASTSLLFNQLYDELIMRRQQVSPNRREKHARCLHTAIHPIIQR